MKKATLLSGILILTLSLSLLGQNSPVKLLKTTTNAEKGSEVLTQYGSQSVTPVNAIPGGTAKGVGINWQFEDPAAVGSQIQVSSETGQTYVSWWLNNKRTSLYEDSPSPVWEYTVDTDWEWPIDMTEDGAWVAQGYDTVAQVFSNSSSAIFWETIVEGTMLGVKLNPDGSKLFIARKFGGNSFVEAYTVGQTDPDWSVQFTGDGTAFTGSDDGSKIIFCQYSGVNKMWVLDGTNGDILFDAFYKNQAKPACSYDGSIILNGDYSGNVHVYEFDEFTNTYLEKWSYKVGGGGTSVWVIGMGVSGDGNTLAVGTLIFLSSGEYDGEIYLFNSWSPEPLWIFQGCGDEVSSIDFAYDGSLMAACGWGPLNHGKPDLWLFRKESSIPYFTINSPGSFNTVDLSSDGTLCAVTGKAVHNREFGSGGLLYNVDSDLDGGILAGTVDLANTADDKNAKIEINELQAFFGYSQSDGSYEIEYIPDGSYSATASKVGYYPETVENVTVIEGETTMLDFSLEETGNPPYNLTASQGTGLSIDLNWECDNANDYDGFNVYRKKIEGDFFPEDPIAVLPNTEFSYEDADVLPLTDYYYVVTTIIDAGVESPYSNVAHGWMSDGFVTGEISVYVGSTPTIDGTISAGEWDDAFMVDASDFLGKYDNTPNPVGSVIMYYKSNEAMTELYVACINENDSVLEDHDEIALYIDDNNDGSYPIPDDLSEGNFWAVHYASGNLIRYRPIYNTGGVGTTIELESPQIEVSDATGHIVYEFVLPIGSDEYWQITPNVDNKSGLFLFVLDDPSAFDGYWPCWNSEIFIPLEYGLMTFNAVDEVPPAPEDMQISWVVQGDAYITIEWSQPDINDFNHFNVYMSYDGISWEFLESTIGRQFLYTTSENYLEFYVTTVDHAGQESPASETVIYDITTTSTGELQQLLHTNIYPNPSTGAVNVSMQLGQAGMYSLRILNMQGIMVETLYSGYLHSGNKIIRWDGIGSQGHRLAPGIYFIQLTGEGGQHTSKLLLLAE